MDWRASTLIWITRLVGLGLLIYVIEPSAKVLSFLWRSLTTSPPTTGNPFSAPKPWGFAEWMGYAIEVFPTVALLLLALHLMLGGRWLLRRMLRGLDGSCPACGHQLPDNGANRCTECGFRFAPRPLAPSPQRVSRSPDGAEEPTP